MTMAMPPLSTPASSITPRTTLVQATTTTTTTRARSPELVAAQRQVVLSDPSKRKYSGCDGSWQYVTTSEVDEMDNEGSDTGYNDTDIHLTQTAKKHRVTAMVRLLEFLLNAKLSHVE